MSKSRKDPCTGTYYNQAIHADGAVSLHALRQYTERADAGARIALDEAVAAFDRDITDRGIGADQGIGILRALTERGLVSRSDLQSVLDEISRRESEAL